MKMAGLTDYFIPPGKRSASRAEISDERIFISVVFISVVFNLLAIKTAYDVQLFPIVYMLLFNAFFSVVILFLYRKGLPRTVTGHLFLFQFEAAFVAQAWLQGGVVSPASAAFFLLPAVAMLIMGKREAVFWIIISTLSLMVIYFIEKYRGSPIINYPVSLQKELFFYSIIATNFCIFSILLVYENAKNRSIRELDKRHNDLVSAQNQLIQSEKMASLGELTSGIAHEIQNPLNFVINFSEISKELFEEMDETLEKGDTAGAREMMQEIIQNLDKINHHGKRVDGIVKGMLQHSRTGSGKKELTDLNALCSEFHRLAYHGFRAKDNSAVTSRFNGIIETDFDDTLPEIHVVPQDMGRVILNLLNNAFHAVSERQKKEEGNYVPRIVIITKELKDKIQIAVKDNGNGIPDAIKEKIFQPFFTTKPTGQGTGLGLSLAYDIVTKGHGGELKVETEAGTTFIIYLPKNN